MELLTELLKLLLPAAIVLYAMFLVIQSFVRKELEQSRTQLAIKQKEVELKNKEQTLPIRLQAYERMGLFLERISPAQLIPRVNKPEFSVGLLQQILIQEIRNEYGHNLAQQMYMTEEAWNLVKRAMEETILLINNSMLELDEDGPGIELAKRILINAREHDINPTAEALSFLKAEVSQLF